MSVPVLTCSGAALALHHLARAFLISSLARSPTAAGLSLGDSKPGERPWPAHSPYILCYMNLLTKRLLGVAASPKEVNLIDVLDEGLLLLDDNRIVTVANFTISQLLGIPTAQLVGRRADELAAESQLFGQLLGQLNAPSSAPSPMFTLTQGTDTGPYELLIRRLPSGWLLTLRSVAEHQQLDQAKWHFLASVSRELQNSLSIMQLSLNRLHDGAAGTLTPEQHNITYTLGRENKHLRKLVGELLDVSQLELGTIQLNFKAVRVPSLVQFVTDTIGPQLQPKRLVLEVQVPDTLPAVRADLEKTTWVLLSLLANAIRYSHLLDHLRIEASLAPDGRHVRVSVQDQGPGIAPADHDKIFRRFAQLPTQGGAGLGLSIAREFVASQGGELGVESTLGAGSTFWFTLPLAEAA
jgi:NtrC-family two-component system sensor histidine kinase KinB